MEPSIRNSSVVRAAELPWRFFLAVTSFPLSMREKRSGSHDAYSFHMLSLWVERVWSELLTWRVKTGTTSVALWCPAPRCIKGQASVWSWGIWPQPFWEWSMFASRSFAVSAELIPPMYIFVRWHPMCIFGLLLEQCSRSKPGYRAPLQSSQRSLTRRSGYVDGTSSPRHDRSIGSNAEARLRQGEGHTRGAVGVF